MSANTICTGESFGPRVQHRLLHLAWKTNLLRCGKIYQHGEWLLLVRDIMNSLFSSVEDVRRVRSVASWNLNLGFLKLFAWQNDFNLNLQRNTSAQVWVRIYGLAQEYWRPTIITTIANCIYSPIIIDAIAFKPMFDWTFGQYVRVLVDLDISQTLNYKILVERKGYPFFFCRIGSWEFTTILQSLQYGGSFY